VTRLIGKPNDAFAVISLDSQSRSWRQSVPADISAFVAIWHRSVQ